MQQSPKCGENHQLDLFALLEVLEKVFEFKGLCLLKILAHNLLHPILERSNMNGSTEREKAMGNEIWILIPLFWIAGWVINTWIQARNGYPVEDSMGNIINPPKVEQLTKQWQEDLAARDQTIAALRERIEVLERIVTDQPGGLAQEIERLRA